MKINYNQLIAFWLIKKFGQLFENSSTFLVLFFFLFISFKSTPALSQQAIPDWNWATNHGGNDYNNGYGITTDNQGNTYVTGDFQGNAVFGNTTLISAGSFDAFVAKYTNGGIAWAIQLGGPDMDNGYSVATDLAGNVYLTGYFQNQITINGELITCYAWRDMFITKISPEGTIEWFRHGGGDFAEGYKIAVNNEGYAAITGSYYSTMQFSESSLTITSNGDTDLFIALYNTDGQLQWANGGGGVLPDLSKGISIDNEGNVLCTGEFYGPATFGSFTLLSPEYATNVCILKIGHDGSWIFAKSFGSSAGGETPFGGHAVDNEGNIYIGGIFSAAELTIGNDVLVNASPGYFDMFYAKFDSECNSLWARHGGGEGTMEYVRGVAVDENGNSYYSGNFEMTAAFGDTALTVVGNTDAFVASYNSIGQLRWAIQAGGPSTDISVSVCSDSESNIFVTGYFYESMGFGDIMLNTISQQDIFIAKIAQTITTGTTQLSTNAPQFSVYPNPTNATLFIRGNNPQNEILLIQVFDLQGSLVKQITLNASDCSLDVSDLKAGMYSILIHTKESIYADKIGVL